MTLLRIFSYSFIVAALSLAGCAGFLSENKQPAVEGYAKLKELCPPASDLPQGFKLILNTSMIEMLDKPSNSSGIKDAIARIILTQLLKSSGISTAMCWYVRENGSNTTRDVITVGIMNFPNTYSDDDIGDLDISRRMLEKYTNNTSSFPVEAFADKTDGVEGVSNGKKLILISFTKGNYYIFVETGVSREDTISIAKKIAGKIPNPEGIYYTSPKDACPDASDLPEGYALTSEEDLSDTIISAMRSDEDTPTGEIEVLEELNKQGNFNFYKCWYETAQGGNFYIVVLKVPEALVGEIDVTQFKEEPDGNFSEFYVEKFTNETQGIRGDYKDGDKVTAVAFRKGNYKSIVMGNLNEEETSSIARIVASRIK